MKKVAVPVLATVIVVGGALVIAPFLLWGENPQGGSPGSPADQPTSEIVVYSEASPDGQVYDCLSSALREMQNTLVVWSAVVTTAVFGESVIIAKNHDEWQTIPSGTLFLLPDIGEPEAVFLDQAEFSLYLKKHPELARACVAAVDLNGFLTSLRSKEPT